MTYDPVPPFRRDFDAARDPYTARNALGIPEPTGGGGTPAPSGAEYITGSADATLTNERVLTSTATVTWDFSTAGQAKANASVDLSAYAPLASPTFTGDPKAPTPATADNDTSIATTAFVKAQGYLTTATAASTYQPLDATLTALAAFNTNGLLTQTAADTFTGRTLTGPAAGITVSNGNGVAGNPTLALANDLAALEALSGTNTIYYRSGADTWSPVNVSTGLAFSSGNLTATATAPTDEYHHGQLSYSSTTALQFKPFNGNKIKINGTIYTIPNAGIAGLANTGIFLNGSSGANLAANSTYWVFAFINSGTVTGYFWNAVGGLTTPFHSPSTAIGNEGVEVWFDGTTQVNTYTLIGMCRTNASAQFVDSAAVRGVLSWFNRRPRVAQGKFSADRSTSSTTLVQINSEIDIGFLTWVEASVLLGTAGATYNSSVGTGQTRIYVDGTALDGAAYGASAAASYATPIGMTAAYGGLTAATEGYHTATLYGSATSGTQTWFGSSGLNCTLTAHIVG